MIELSGEFLRKEIVRLGALVTETAIYHPLGRKLHSESDPLTPANAKAMYDVMLEKVYLLEPGEDEKALARLPSTQRVALGGLVAGDVLLENVQNAQGAVVLATGSTLKSEDLNLLHTLPLASVEIRKRARLLEREELEGYIAKAAALRETTIKYDPQLTRILRLTPIPIRMLLVPRSRVLLASGTSSDRQMIAGMLKTAGHQTWELESLDQLDATVSGTQIDVVVAGVNDLGTLGLDRRVSLKLHRLEVLALVEEETASQKYRALDLGANDVLPKLPKRDLLLERVRGLMALLEKKVSLAPVVLTERRKDPRVATRLACELSDPMIQTPLPVGRGEILNSGPGGAMVEYNCPPWPVPWAYTPHGVHPKHFWSKYSRGNPLSRSIRIQLTPPQGAPLETIASVVSVEPNAEFERIRLAFERPLGSTARQTTKIRPRPS
jgi:CheY-like chemotaxis protein